jgi:hypothetical protein
MSLSFTSPFSVTAFIALSLACSQCALGAHCDVPAVKVSDSSICHVLGALSYWATPNFKASETLADCTNAGGHLPKPGKQIIADTDGQPATSIGPTLKENPGVAAIRSIPSRDIAIGAMLVIAVCILVGFVRFRARRYPRINLKRVFRPSGSDVLSADEKRLLKACRGSKEVAERLIQLEFERNPALSRGRAAAAAVRRHARQQIDGRKERFPKRSAAEGKLGDDAPLGTHFGDVSGDADTLIGIHEEARGAHYIPKGLKD